MFDRIVDLFHAENGGIVTLMAGAGSGKTFLVKAILHESRKRTDMHILPVASSALAASLLSKARTAHSAFKIPVDINEHSQCICSVEYKSFLRQFRGFIWDEASMAHLWCVDAVDRLLQDIHKCSRPFGGCVMIFIGDWQQLLPIHRFCSDPTAYCIKAAHWYPFVEHFSLTTNVRAATDPTFCSFLQRVGSGDNPVEFPSECCVQDVSALIAKVWPTENHMHDFAAVLTATREDGELCLQSIIISD